MQTIIFVEYFKRNQTKLNIKTHGFSIIAVSECLINVAYNITVVLKLKLGVQGPAVMSKTY